MAWQFVGVGQFQLTNFPLVQSSEFSIVFRELEGVGPTVRTDTSLNSKNGMSNHERKILPKINMDKRREESLLRHKERMIRSKPTVLPPLTKPPLRAKTALVPTPASTFLVLPKIPTQMSDLARNPAAALHPEANFMQSPEGKAEKTPVSAEECLDERFMEENDSDITLPAGECNITPNITTSSEKETIVKDTFDERSLQENGNAQLDELYSSLLGKEKLFLPNRLETSHLERVELLKPRLETLRVSGAEFGARPWAVRLRRPRSEPSLRPPAEEVWSAVDLDSSPASDPGPSRQTARRLKQIKSVDNFALPERGGVTPTPIKIPVNLRSNDNKFTPPDAPIIFVLGGPGSGKISHCEQLTAISEGMVHINMLATLGNMAQELSSGNRYDATNVPAYKALEVLIYRLSDSPFSNCYLISGYPRHMRDVVEYLSKVQRIDGVVILDWSVRSLERQVQLGAQLKEIDINLARKDLANYRTNVIPVAEFFDQQGLLHIVAGERPPQQVFEDLVEEIRGILAYPPGAWGPQQTQNAGNDPPALPIRNSKPNENRSSSAPLSLRDQILSLSTKYGKPTVSPTMKVNTAVQIHQSESEPDPPRGKSAPRKQSFDSVDLLINEELKLNHLETVPPPIAEEEGLRDGEDTTILQIRRATMKPAELALEKDIESIINMVQADALLEAARNKSKKS